jgi:hypothetical protein
MHDDSARAPTHTHKHIHTFAAAVTGRVKPVSRPCSVDSTDRHVVASAAAGVTLTSACAVRKLDAHAAHTRART